jgi:class 3 adenylate cyclase
MEALIVEEVVTPTALSPAACWALVSDTDRLNREAGLSPMTLTPARGRGAVRYVADTVIGPFRVAFEELPFEWTAPERLVIRRRMTRGPARMLVVQFVVTPRAEGTAVTTRIEVELVARRWKPAGVMVARWVASRMDRAIRRHADELLRAADQPPARTSGEAPGPSLPPVQQPRTARSDLLLMPKVSVPPGARTQWAERVRRELGTSPAEAAALVERLVSWVLGGPQHQVVRLRPYELAAEWSASPRVVLELCLAATVAGLLELTWDLVCPSCRTATTRGTTLAVLGATTHCEQCDLTFGLELDRAVEATFRPARAARVVDEVRYCSGGPAMTPHVLAQRVLEPGATSTLVVPIEATRLRLFARGGAMARVELSDSAAATVDAHVHEATMTPAVLEVAPGGTIVVHLDGGEPRHVKLERLDWASHAATAHDVSLIPRFRQRFSGEVLKPGLALAVSRVALVFSDLGASTAMYTQHGDAVAFRLVQDHFELLAGIVAAHGGTVVKTIGDAVMAAFADEASGLDAACAMSAAFPAFRAARPFADRVSLKLGLYAGPCYVVEANGALDYFGQTVNMAARLQAQAHDDELVVTEQAWREASEARALPARAAARDEVRLKGIDGVVQIVRVVVR